MKRSISTLVAGTILLVASQILAQETGTSHPEALNDSLSTSVEHPASTPRPVVAPKTAAHSSSAVAASQNEPASQPVLHSHAAEPLVCESKSDTAADGADAGIVTSFPVSDTELAEGTIIKARLTEEVSTETTKPGTHFSAQLIKNVERGGKVIFPVGATVSGRVTAAHSGRRVNGGAAIHLEPEKVTLPDGTIYRLSARVIDLGPEQKARVNSEGTIMGSDPRKGTLPALALVTGGGAAAGGMLGGVPGAVIGAGVGAGAGTVVWLKEETHRTLKPGTQVVFSLTRPMDLTPTYTALARKTQPLL